MLSVLQTLRLREPGFGVSGLKTLRSSSMDNLRKSSGKQTPSPLKLIRCTISPISLSSLTSYRPPLSVSYPLRIRATDRTREHSSVATLLRLLMKRHASRTSSASCVRTVRIRAVSISRSTLKNTSTMTAGRRGTDMVLGTTGPIARRATGATSKTYFDVYNKLSLKYYKYIKRLYKLVLR